MDNSDVYECEHQNKTLRKVESEYSILVCNKCHVEFTNAKTQPLSLAKQILTLSNKMIENTPTFMNGKGPDNSLNLWHNCNKDVLEQLKKLNLTTENKKRESNIVDNETDYNFDEILHETEVNNDEHKLDGKNLHNLYRHSTKLIK